MKKLHILTREYPLQFALTKALVMSSGVVLYEDRHLGDKIVAMGNDTSNMECIPSSRDLRRTDVHHIPHLFFHIHHGVASINLRHVQQP